MISTFRKFFQSKLGITITLAFLALIGFAFASADVTNTGMFGGIAGGERIAVVGDERIDSRALFIMIGAAPNTAWLSNLVETDAKGFVKTGAQVGRETQFETSTDGIFAVGDVREGSVKRVASAVGEGSVVVSRIWQYVHQLEAGANAA